MARTALAPSVADASLICFEFTSDHSIRCWASSQRTAHRTVREKSACDPSVVGVTDVVGGETATSRRRRTVSP
jgi:hypothetical protein